MKSLIIYEKNKSLADFLSDFYIKKQIGGNIRFNTKKIEELSSTSLFSFAENTTNANNDLWGLPTDENPLEDFEENSVSAWNIEPSENNANNVFTAAPGEVNIIHIENKADSEKFVHYVENGELSHRVNSDDVVYSFVFTYFESSHAKKVKKWAEDNSIKMISPILLDKRSPQVTVASLGFSSSLSKDKAKILSTKVGSNYGYSVPFLRTLEDKDFSSMCDSLDSEKFSILLDDFLPKQSPDRIPPWDWKKCWKEGNFEGFSRAILAVERDCGDVVLIRNMYKDLSAWYRVKVLTENGMSLAEAASMSGNVRLDYYSKIFFSKKNLSSGDVFQLGEIVLEAYDSIMSGAQNKKTLVSTMIVKMWDVFDK